MDLIELMEDAICSAIMSANDDECPFKTSCLECLILHCEKIIESNENFLKLY